MHDFRYVGNQLFCERVSVESLVKKFGTPLYVYSQHTLEDHFRKLDLAFRPVDHLICFSVKANSNAAVMRTLASLGSGFDVVSEGELRRVIAPVAVRVNPNVAAGTHAKITTGTYENKFGIALEEVEGVYARARKLRNLRLRGLQMHIGSQLTAVRPFELAVRKVLPLVAKLAAQHPLEFFSIGGGLGI